MSESNGVGAILVSAAVEAERGAELERVAPGVPRLVLAGEDRVGRGADRDGVDASGTVGPLADGAVSQVAIACFSNDLFPDVDRDLCRRFWRTLRGASALRWLHSCSAGVDDRVFQELLARGVRLTTGSGAAATPIAHTVMLYLLAQSRGLRALEEARRRREWRLAEVGDLEGRVLGVVGLGPIGREVARLGAAFGMRVIGVRRTPSGDEPCESWPLARLPDLAAVADFLVLALPLVGATRALVGREVLARLRPSAFLVNVGRGGLIDEPALVEVLREGRIAGAALDVVAEEPLPPTSPLWDLPNVILTPHCAGETPRARERALDVFVENLPRWLAGVPLRNEVDPEGTRTSA